MDLTEMVATAVEPPQRRHPHAMISTTLDEDVAVRGGAVAVLDPAEGTGARIEVRLPVGGRMDGSSPGGPSWMAAASP
ncbi:MAG TPA: hypothetical protein VGP70_10730 [Actinomadura sp.]|nr:hypothetical protein [Actinomadura sp.]